MRFVTLIICLCCALLVLPALAQDTQPPTGPDGQPLVPLPPPPEVTAEPVAFAPDVLELLANARTDLELLAASTLGVTRPEGWSGSLEVNNPQLPILIRLDLELLAGINLSETRRPDGWFGAIGSTPYAVARDIRHDLELLADFILGATQRPEGWTDINPVLRCSRSTQTLVLLLSRGSGFVNTVDPATPDYCAQLELLASRFSEQALLSLPREQSIFAAQTSAALPGAITIDTEFGVAFLDRSASLRVGVIPNGTPVTAVARSFAQFSKMALVEGDNFLVFVNFEDTTLNAEEFETLPNADEYPQATFCGARWCSGG